ncbi:hypothetical protein QCD60_29530 [Pokkaliibacter sp. MBI-7]|uniref:hypothetical protein n=1 Tax=Pokkaliibacter sp. MBI-7 TaxID=3040600 RepID=UPI00244C9AB1|nr:hypothetical protein [Pokkaliibacter sp. MBI-7]MDH2434786.1 hypothetical protein [Pokkaliibacter sp. MBI-7]MDH2436659.1 hypothetical protein [Pokkaliibacter sp. MBI-7]
MMENLSKDVAQSMAKLSAQIEELIQATHHLADAVADTRNKYYELENHVAISDSLVALIVMNHPAPDLLHQEWNRFIAHSVAELATAQARLRQVDDVFAEQLSVNRKKVISNWTQILKTASENRQRD